MTSSSYNNGVGETRSYNDDNTLASISYSGAAIGDLTYGWDANKNKTSESIGGVMSGYGFSAGYDAEDRLTSWDRADTNLDQSWNLSPVGDWNSITENSSVQNDGSCHPQPPKTLFVTCPSGDRCARRPSNGKNPFETFTDRFTSIPRVAEPDIPLTNPPSLPFEPAPFRTAIASKN